MANENIGKMKCPHCGEVARVRKNCKTPPKLYYCCPDCGLIQGTGGSFQRYILDNATMHGVEGDPAQDKPSAPPAPPAVEVKPQPVEVNQEVKPAAPAKAKSSSWGFTG